MIFWAVAMKHRRRSKKLSTRLYMKMQQIELVVVLITAGVVVAYGSKPQASSQSGMHDGMQQSNSQENPAAMPSKMGIALTTDPSPAKRAAIHFASS